MTAAAVEDGDGMTAAAVEDGDGMTAAMVVSITTTTGIMITPTSTKTTTTAGDRPHHGPGGLLLPPHPADLRLPAGLVSHQPVVDPLHRQDDDPADPHAPNHSSADHPTRLIRRLHSARWG